MTSYALSSSFLNERGGGVSDSGPDLSAQGGLTRETLSPGGTLNRWG